MTRDTAFFGVERGGSQSSDGMALRGPGSGSPGLRGLIDGASCA